jgi:branched-chain amino acid transport system substrate-binding protein
MNRFGYGVAAIIATISAVSAHADQSVTLGFAGPLTGPVAHIGKDAENGARVAIDEANGAGIKIKGQAIHFLLDSQDDQGDPKTAVTVAQKLVDANVAGVIGHINSGATLPASKVYSTAGIPQISPSATNSELTRQGFGTAYRVIGSDAYVGRVIAQYLTKTKGLKRIAIVDDRTAYGQGLADEVSQELKADGAEVVDREFVTANSVDFRSILTNIKAKNAQAIFYGGTDAQGGPMRKQMSSLAMTIPLVGSGLETDNFVNLAGASAAEGTLSAEPGEPLDKLARGKEFEAKFAKYGSVVIFAPNAYDAVWALINAMKLANSTVPQDYLPALKKIDFQGVTGRIAFDNNGDLRTAAVTLYEAKSGHFVPVETSTLK